MPICEILSAIEPSFGPAPTDPVAISPEPVGTTIMPRADGTPAWNAKKSPAIAPVVVAPPLCAAFTCAARSTANES